MQTAYAQKNETTQRAADNTAAAVHDNSPQSESLQRKASLANAAVQRAENPPRPNNTGLPDDLKNGIESLSGYSLDNVRVHYNSPKPATVQALAYTQGTDIHVAPGQEHALPHEAWHVAQQMAGRVSPTTNINGLPVNDNAALEHEADVMGEKATYTKGSIQLKKNSNSLNTIQRDQFDDYLQNIVVYRGDERPRATIRESGFDPGALSETYMTGLKNFLRDTSENTQTNRLKAEEATSCMRNRVGYSLGNGEDLVKTGDVLPNKKMKLHYICTAPGYEGAGGYTYKIDLTGKTFTISNRNSGIGLFEEIDPTTGVVKQNGLKFIAAKFGFRVTEIDFLTQIPPNCIKCLVKDGEQVSGGVTSGAIWEDL